MGWGNCGTDSKGRPIGYVFDAVCDAPGCYEDIDRGLAYACGGMHGDDPGCELYFCDKHLHIMIDPDGDMLSVCDKCCDYIKIAVYDKYQHDIELIQEADNQDDQADVRSAAVMPPISDGDYFDVRGTTTPPLTPPPNPPAMPRGDHSESAI